MTAPKLSKAQRELLSSLARFGPHEVYGAQLRSLESLYQLGFVDTYASGAMGRKTAAEVTPAGLAALKDSGAK